MNDTLVAPAVKTADERYQSFLLERFSTDRDTTDHAERYDPSAFDYADYAACLASVDAETHTDEPTPVEVLDADAAPWWASLPISPKLDGDRWELVESASDRWIAEEMASARRRATRGDDRGRDTTAEDALIDRLGRVEYPE